MKTCQQCGRVLAGKQKKFCSLGCRDRGSIKSTTCVCKGCGKEFSVKPYEAKRGRGNFCSAECYQKTGLKRPRYGGRKRITKICPVCHKEFETGGRSGNRDQIVCSDECQRVSRFRNGAKSNELTAIEAAYLAGFTDGEGAIMLASRRDKASVKLSITNRDLDILQWIKEVTGIGNVNQHRKETGSHAATWFFHCNSDAAVTIIEQILPYLRIKKQQAQLAIETQQRLRDPALNADRIWQREYIEQMKKLNKRGPK